MSMLLSGIEQDKFSPEVQHRELGAALVLGNGGLMNADTLGRRCVRS